MLKKLVKYGNSNALVLDKAILELLDIEEGSVLKIQTDGKSIILTPQATYVGKVQETVTSDQASIEAMVKEFVARDKNLAGDKQQQLEAELQELLKKHQELSAQLHKNPEYLKELQQLQKTAGFGSPESIEAYKALKAKYSPELLAIDERLMAMGKSFAMPELTEKQKKAMEMDFLNVFTKNKEMHHAFAVLQNNPEYIDKAQLLAEKYQNDKNSTAYFAEVDKLNDSYIPGYSNLRKELAAVSQKYSK